tara:strand:+ start:9400 stop:10110 length:711 start_codon:yes stop_codon:yes gene_type:complete
VRKTLGILQPGRIGDIIMSLPIAKYYYDRGYKVIWPIGATFIKQFSYAADYIHFIPVRHNDVTDTANWHVQADWILNQFDCDTKLDLLFNMTNTDEATRKWKESGLKFDEYRYNLANVPLDEKWNLSIKRNKQREDDLFDKIVTQEKYVVYQFTGAGFRRTVKIENNGNFQLIEITRLTENSFDWLRIIEGASKLVLLDSSFANLVEQLNMPNDKYFLLRSPDIMTPTLKNKWIMI